MNPNIGQESSMVDKWSGIQMKKCVVCCVCLKYMLTLHSLKY